MNDRFDPIFGGDRGSDRSADESDPTLRSRIAAFIDRANEETASIDYLTVTDRLSHLAGDLGLSLTPGSVVMGWDGSEGYQGVMMRLFAESSESQLGWVLALYAPSFKSDPPTTFARFLPLIAPRVV